MAVRNRRRNRHEEVGFARLLLRRSWLVVLVAALAGATAWWFTKDDPRIYEHTLTFVVRPADTVPRANIPDTVRSLSDHDAQLVTTIAGVLGDPRLLVEAGPRVFDGRIPDLYSSESSVRPGSDIIEVHLRGPDPARLQSLGSNFASVASAWLADRYSVYGLEHLSAEASEGPVEPNVPQTMTLAVLLGLLVALGGVFLEAKVRDARAVRRPVVSQEDRQPVVTTIDRATSVKD